MAASPEPEPDPAGSVARARARLPRALRLVRARDFQRVYRTGNRARGDLMTVAAAPNEAGVTRLGLSVGRVVFRHAVRRNRVKRVLREAFRLEHGELPAGVDLVLIPARGVLPDLADARRELVRLAHKAWRRYRERTAPPPEASP